MRTGKKLAVAILILAGSARVYAADCNEGMVHYMDGDARQAMKIFTALAQKGDGCAQFQIGMMHFFGHGTQPDEKIARQWISKSAKSGFAKAKEALTRWEEMKRRPDLTSGA